MWNATGPDSNRNAPPGVVPDYNHPEDVYWTLNIVLTVICVFFVTAFFLVRVYVKRTINRNIGVEDCTYKVCMMTKLTIVGTCLVAFVRQPSIVGRFLLTS
ncbi:hypothetical protein EDB82DRAFT_282232 [Fusarium venenatum]|uniref:uncharacterized protein n=1 Tax=Fusarium venenatum TaxID=56646 RepID=UPI001D7423FF|nr:hypothetical protein EDB82DRAFT_282232 [Fusarium venenatum]